MRRRSLKKPAPGSPPPRRTPLNEWLSDAPSSLIQVAEGAGELLQELLNGLKKRQYAGAAFLLCVDSSSLLLGAYCGKDAIADGLSAGDMIREVAALAGGKGGGRADQARGSAPRMPSSPWLPPPAILLTDKPLTWALSDTNHGQEDFPGRT